MADMNCNNSSKNESTDKCIPFYDHEHTMMHYNWANRRMLIALVAVCLTFIITIVVFVTGYTTREKNWLNTLSNMNRIEVSDGKSTD
jgi:hypothetical protein